MANIFTYLRWRGDLSFAQSPFCEVDALVLARLSYIPFEGFVKGDFAHTTPLGEMAADFLRQPDADKRVLMQNDITLLRMIAENRRFRDVRLCGYRNLRDAGQEMQFSAVTFRFVEPDAPAVCVAYRGTDNTLIGWKEDFNMSFMEAVPAQRRAVAYLREAAEQTEGEMLLCGHSKGGNLAVYAAAFCGQGLQARIGSVYNFDGPGFGEKVIGQAGYQAICGRVRTFVPQSSVIGMLLEHEEQYTIIHSTQTGLYQHDIYSWEMERASFCRLATATNSSRMVDRSLKDWIASMTPEEREKFFDALFSILHDTNAATLRELSENWYKNALIMARSLKNMDEASRKLMGEVLRLLLRAARNNVSILLPRRPRREDASAELCPAEQTPALKGGAQANKEE